jgi:hypothetical protein
MEGAQPGAAQAPTAWHTPACHAGCMPTCLALPPLQMKLEPPALFCVHLELGTDDGNALRVTVGNVLKEADAGGSKVRHAGRGLGSRCAMHRACWHALSLILTLPLAPAHPAMQRAHGKLPLALPSPSRRWTLLCVDLAAAARTAGGAPFAALRSLQLCSTMSVRGAFSSDIRFGLEVRRWLCWWDNT